ncbi:MAG: hypothetical protein ACE5K1_01265 [Acidiferrobacterales bacterium]
MRTLRKIIDIGLPFVGVAAILGAVLFVREPLSIQIAIVGVGMLMLEVGSWKLRQHVMASRRSALALRAEGDGFLRLVRQLHAAALALKENDSPEHHQAFEEVRDAMRQSVERMADLAGKTNAVPASKPEVGGQSAA